MSADFKPFSPEGRAQSGADQYMRGRLCAFAPVLTGSNDEMFGLGIATANEPGYMPVSPFWCSVSAATPGAYRAMCEHADALNRERGLSPELATLIVASSMFPNDYRERIARQVERDKAKAAS
jgi:hypothetical protein